MTVAVQVILSIIAYVVLGGVLARIFWPVQKAIDRRAIKRDPRVLRSTWSDHLATMCIFWPIALLAYTCVLIAIVCKTIFSIGIPPEDQ